MELITNTLFSGANGGHLEVSDGFPKLLQIVLARHENSNVRGDLCNPFRISFFSVSHSIVFHTETRITLAMVNAHLKDFFEAAFFISRLKARHPWNWSSFLWPMRTEFKST